MKKLMWPCALLLSSIFATSSFAAVVAVIDSGVDYEHPQLSNQIYKNLPEQIGKRFVDDDHNGYADDVYGWNFYGNNNMSFDTKYRWLFNKDVEKYYMYEYAMFLDGEGYDALNGELKDWFMNVLYDKDGNSNDDIFNRTWIFGDYAHGTHVAGIVAKYQGNKILPVKILPSIEDESNSDLWGAIKRGYKRHPTDAMIWGSEPSNLSLSRDQMKKMRVQLEAQAKEEARKNAPMLSYVAESGAQVANASYGTSFLQVLGMIASELPDYHHGQVRELANFYMEKLFEYSEGSFKAMKDKVLFVAASGNYGLDNDEEPDYPSSIDADNIISVGATWSDAKIASFSHYGKNSVDVFAPGVAIHSTVPSNVKGGASMLLSGTSQATPQVSRVAGHILDVNPNLTPKEVKRIIIGTVDKKDFLKGKCVSEGIVNEERAVYAAQLIKDGEWFRRALRHANEDINDVDYGPLIKSASGDQELDESKLPLSQRLNTISIHLDL